MSEGVAWGVGTLHMYNYNAHTLCSVSESGGTKVGVLEQSSALPISPPLYIGVIK